MAGDFSDYLVDHQQVPENIFFLGRLDRNQMAEFYRKTRMIVVPSTWHETFGLVVAESLACKTLVIVANMGALPEVAGPGGIILPLRRLGGFEAGAPRIVGESVALPAVGEGGG